MKPVALLAGLLASTHVFAQTNPGTPVPEPETLALVGIAAAAGIAAAWLRQRK